MSAPKLRFKEFDEDWSESKLKDCIDSIDSGWSPQCESYPADENEWAVLKTTSVDWDGFKANFNKKLPSNLEARFEIEVKPKDILVTRAGPTERVGVVAVVPHNVRSKLMISDKLIRLKADNDNNPEFLGISLSSVKCQNQLQSKTSGLAKSQTNISQKILSDVSLITPSKLEQTKIASFLSAVDEKISQLTQKHELLSQYKQGMMQKLFSQQIRFKADDGSEFGEWDTNRIQDVFTNKSKNFNPQIEENLPCIELEHLSQNTGKILGTIKSSEQQSTKNLFKKNCVLFGKLRPYLRKFAKPQFTGVCSSEIWVLTGIKISNNYLFHYIQSEHFSELTNIQSGSKMPRADWNVISEAEIEYPCLEEQTKIANFLSSIDQKVEVVTQQIEQAKQWKKGLLQQMFV
ncbi:MAG: restriction endonuclease subunit S [Acinetobacter sp.]